MARILVVEDSMTDMVFIVDTLKGANYDVVTAIDGEQAEEKLGVEKIDLMILDVVMPKKNGFQVCRDVKKNNELGHIPIIMLTSKNLDSDKMWGMKQGANVYLTKPIEPLDLLLNVKKQLQEGSS